MQKRYISVFLINFVVDIRFIFTYAAASDRLLWSCKTSNISLIRNLFCGAMRQSQRRITLYYINMLLSLTLMSAMRNIASDVWYVFQHQNALVPQ